MNTQRFSALPWPALAGILGSALLLGLYARIDAAWPLGFVVLVPWLLVLNRPHSLPASLLNGLIMSMAFALAVFGWFAAAVGSYTGIGSTLGMLLLGLLAPLLQPQVLALVLVRQWIGRHHGPYLRALAGASAWVACEWLLPKLLGDTLGHGFAASTHLRQIADLGGAAGISFLLILVNEALALAISRRRDGRRSLLAPLLLAPLLLAALVPAAMFGYGVLRLSSLQQAANEPAPSIRVGMVQASITDYESLRREMGTYAVVRHILDTHFALSRAAIEHHQVDALLWSETVYPTTFAHPRSEDGAALDQEILDLSTELGVPLVFGTYDLGVGKEYNAAAFIEPQSGLLGFYRKTHPFPLTEHVPPWLDGPLLRRWLPWAGSWQPGNGARVFPLRTADGRVLQVLPLICLDDVRPALAIEGARLGAQAIIGLSNDAWFSADPLGARLHLAVSAFRSIETRLPQLRVTSNGLSAFIDPSGEVLAQTGINDRAVLAGAVPIRDPAPTLMLRWGDWVGGAALALLLLITGRLAIREWTHRRSRSALAKVSTAQTSAQDFSADVVLLSLLWRSIAGALRLIAGIGLATLALMMLLGEGMQVNALWQIKLFLWAVVLPVCAAWAIQRSGAARLCIEDDQLILQQRRQRTQIPLSKISTLRAWRLPLPASGIDLQLASGRRWTQGIVLADPHALLSALKAVGSPVRWSNPLSQTIADYARLRAAASRPRLDHPLVKFVLFALVPALPAFRLHQHIAYGGTFGEYYTYGLGAWLLGLGIWWIAWSIGLMLFAAALRIGSETITLIALRWRPQQAGVLRSQLEWLSRLLFYVGVPAWLLMRILVG